MQFENQKDKKNKVRTDQLFLSTENGQRGGVWGVPAAQKFKQNTKKNHEIN